MSREVSSSAPVTHPSIPSPSSALAGRLELFRKVCRQNAERRLSPDDAEDFVSWAVVKLLSGDRRPFERFRGESQLRTYLVRVTQRLLLDYYNHRWGRWRPCAAAMEAGVAAVELDRLVHRDGWTVSAAIQQLRRNQRVAESSNRLHTIAAQLPLRPQTAAVPLPERELPAPGRADQRAVQRERQAERRRIGRIVSDCLSEVAEEDRLLLERRFLEGRSVSEIAGQLGVPAKPLYGRIERALRAIRIAAEQRGLCGGQVRAVIGDPEASCILDSPLARDAAN